MAARKRSRQIDEWVGAIRKSPAMIQDEDGGYWPDILLWVDGDGHVLGTAIELPGEGILRASANLREIMAMPMVGPPRRPSRVRVATPELAAALLDEHREFDIVVGPTPEVDVVFEAMMEAMQTEHVIAPSDLGKGVAPERVGALCEASADLYKLKPWEVVPDSDILIAITIESLGLIRCSVSVTGQLRESYGVTVFRYPTDLVLMAHAADHDAIHEMPWTRNLFYEEQEDVPPSLLEAFVDNGWKRSGRNVVPVFVAREEGDPWGQALSHADTVMMEAIVRGLVHAFRSESAAVRAAFREDAALKIETVVVVDDEKIEMSIEVPHPDQWSEPELRDGLLAQIAEADHAAIDGGDDEWKERTRLHTVLVEAFVASPEAQDLQDADACRVFIEGAVDGNSASIGTLLPEQLTDLLFDQIPRKLCADPDDASEIVGAGQALFQFLKRTYGLPHFDACLRVFGDSAVARLSRALADSSRFGFAKSFFMEGTEAGFDMTTEEGIAAWQAKGNKMI